MFLGSIVCKEREMTNTFLCRVVCFCLIGWYQMLSHRVNSILPCTTFTAHNNFIITTFTSFTSLIPVDLCIPYSIYLSGFSVSLFFFLLDELSIFCLMLYFIWGNLGGARCFALCIHSIGWSFMLVPELRFFVALPDAFTVALVLNLHRTCVVAPRDEGLYVMHVVLRGKRYVLVPLLIWVKNILVNNAMFSQWFLVEVGACAINNTAKLDWCRIYNIQVGSACHFYRIFLGSYVEFLFYVILFVWFVWFVLPFSS